MLLQRVRCGLTTRCTSDGYTAVFEAFNQPPSFIAYSIQEISAADEPEAARPISTHWKGEVIPCP